MMKTESIEISAFCYGPDHLEESQRLQISDIRNFMQAPGIKWLNIDDTENQEILTALSEEYKLHPLLVEDILHGKQRPKLEEYDEHLFIVLNTLRADHEKGLLVSEQVSFVLGKDYVLSFQEAGIPGDVFDLVRLQIRGSKEKIRKSGADYLLYSLMDTVIDNYFMILETIGDKLVDHETDFHNTSSSDSFLSLYRLRKDLQQLRKSVWPLRELTMKLDRNEIQLIHNTTRPYFRNLYDHAFQVLEGTEAFRETLTSILDLQLSISGMKMNNVMKVLTVISTIFMPLTFIVGVYGMNFDNMPELHWHYGYYVIMVACFILVILMTVFFRRRGWLRS